MNTLRLWAAKSSREKAVLNGGILIGTLDGANIEIREHVGAENMFIFGQTTEEIAAWRTRGCNSASLVREDAELAEVIEKIRTMSGGIFQPIVDILLHNDRYFHCADFRSYIEAQERAAQAWQRADEWNRMSILNTARSGYFSGDRTVREYAREIWGVGE